MREFWVSGKPTGNYLIYSICDNRVQVNDSIINSGGDDDNSNTCTVLFKKF